MTISNVSAACTNWSIEITPPSSKNIEKFSDILEEGKSVNITFLPGTDFEDTINAAKKLREEGMNPVPHLAARSFQSLENLNELLFQLTNKVKITEVLLIAGGLKTPLGSYTNTMQILNSGILQKYKINNVGVAGHPEGSPDISNKELENALFEKNSYAIKEGINMYIETQFCFDAKKVLSWEKNIRELGNVLPIKIGIPGPATIKALFRFAKISGIGPSMNFIAKQAKNVTKLLTIQSPDKLLLDLSNKMASDKDCLISGFHFYPFGGFTKTVSYANALSSGKFEILPNGKFFYKV